MILSKYFFKLYATFAYMCILITQTVDWVFLVCLIVVRHAVFHKHHIRSCFPFYKKTKNWLIWTLLKQILFLLPIRILVLSTVLVDRTIHVLVLMCSPILDASGRFCCRSVEATSLKLFVVLLASLHSNRSTHVPVYANRMKGIWTEKNLISNVDSFNSKYPNL